MKVICQICKGHFFDTTDRYRPGVVSHGAMFKVTDAFSSWDVFPQNQDQTFGALECPGCGNLMHNGDGKVMVAGWTENETAKKNAAMDALMAEYDVDFVTDESVTDDAEKENVIGNDDSGKVHCPVCNGLYFENRMHIHIKAKHPEMVE